MTVNNDNDFNKKSVRMKKKARNIYGDQLICLSALLIMAVWRSGWRALMLVAVSTLTGVLVDFICCRMSKKVYNPRDLSTIAAGMCIALMMPASVSYPLVVCGSALAMGVKHIFGGKDNYIFNPTAVAMAFLIISYPSDLLLFPKPGETLPVFGEINVTLSSGIESYLMKMGTAQQLSLYDMMLGNFQGPIGTTHILVILVCAVCLMFRRSISTTVTLSSLSVIIIIASIFPLYDNFANTMALELIGGYLLFGLLFLANDPQTIPKTNLGKLIYGVVLGISVIAFRYFGKVEGSFVFALLAANSFSVRMDRAAEKMIDRLYRLNLRVRSRLSFYERFSQEAKEGNTSVKNLSDTQEIILNPINYDMPPIDNKVIKINRKKPNLLTRTKEKIGTLGDNGNETDVMLPVKSNHKSQKPIPKEKPNKNFKFLHYIKNLMNGFMKTRRERNTVKPVRHKSQPVNPALSEQKNNLADILNEAVNIENLKDEKGKNAFEEYLSDLRTEEEQNKTQKITNNTDSIEETDNITQNSNVPEDDIDITDFDELVGMPGIMDEDQSAVKEEKTVTPQSGFNKLKDSLKRKDK